MSLSTRRLVIIGGFTAMATALVAPSVHARTTELPRYEVVSTHDGFELRRYAPRIVAEVEVRGRSREATNAGFRVLADYIFGNNTARDSIAMTAPVDRRASETIDMTAPVDRRRSDEERWVITFTMPRKYTLDTLPRPNDPRVKIQKLAPTHFAVVRFSGAPSDKRVQQRMDALATAIERAGLATAGKPPTYARYDPPWTLPVLRRNEILIELKLDDDDDERR